MKKQILKALIVVTATAGLAAPRAVAAEPISSVVRSNRVANTLDVALSGKTLHGQVVNAQNVPQAGLPVNVLSHGEIVAQATTDEHGAFRASVNRGGVYVVDAGGDQQVVRTWSEGAAPPTAQDGVLLVTEDAAVRGQSGVVGRCIIPAIIVGGMATWIAIEACDDDSPSGS